MSLDLDLFQMGDFPEDVVCFSFNVTHNLIPMAKEAGIYLELWYPEEKGITEAWRLLKPLRKAQAALIAEPKRFERFNPPNGWGSYSIFLQFVGQVLAKCEEHPYLKVRASR